MGFKNWLPAGLFILINGETYILILDMRPQEGYGFFQEKFQNLEDIYNVE